jgi:hypothetical protein
MLTASRYITQYLHVLGDMCETGRDTLLFPMFHIYVLYFIYICGLLIKTWVTFVVNWIVYLQWVSY